MIHSKASKLFCHILCFALAICKFAISNSLASISYLLKNGLDSFRDIDIYILLLEGMVQLAINPEL